MPTTIRDFRRVPGTVLKSRTAVTAAVVVLAAAAGGILFPGFWSARVAVNLLGDGATLSVAAIGATFVILAGGIDLSAGAVMAFTGILIAAAIERLGIPPSIAIAGALAAGAAFGAAQGAVIHVSRLPAFLVTLAGMFLARGLGFVVHPRSLGLRHPFYVETVNETLAIPLGGGLSFPVTATVFLALLAVAFVILRSTRFGRCVHAIGDDEAAAHLLGVPVARTRILVYAAGGFHSAAAGVVATFYTQSGDPASSVGFELDAIAAVVIGGTLLRGGAGSVLGTFLGVVLLGLIQTLINFHGGLSSWWTRICAGLLLLAFLTLQRVFDASAGRRGGASAP